MSLPEGCSSGLIIPWKLENGVDPVVFDDEHKTLTMNIFQCDDPDVQVVSEVLTANCQDKPGKTGGVLVNVTSGACYDAGGDEQPCTGVASDGLHRNIQTTITIDEASVIQDPTLYSDEVIEGDMKGVVSFCIRSKIKGNEYVYKNRPWSVYFDWRDESFHAASGSLEVETVYLLEQAFTAAECPTDLCMTDLEAEYATKRFCQVECDAIEADGRRNLEGVSEVSNFPRKHD